MTYLIGSRRKLVCVITGESGSPIDPDVLTFEMHTPDGQVTTYVYGTDPGLVRDSLGVFHVYWDCTQNGLHRYSFVASGSIAAVQDGIFQVGAEVYPSAFDLGQWLPDADPADPNVLWCIEAAADAVEKACGRTFRAVTAPEQRTFQAEYFRGRTYSHGRTLVDIDDLMTTEDLVIEVDGTAVTDYVLLPRNASQKNRPWTQVEIRQCVPGWFPVWGDYVRPHHGWVRITARWGWTEVPSAIRTATAITAARLYDRRQNVAGALVDKQVDDIELKWAVSSIDPDVETLVAPYRKLWAAA